MGVVCVCVCICMCGMCVCVCVWMGGERVVYEFIGIYVCVRGCLYVRVSAFVRTRVRVSMCACMSQ
jgi:hypothetical protein